MKIEDIKKIANNEWGDYQVYGKSFKYNNLVNTTTTSLILENGKTYFINTSGVASIQVGAGTSMSVSSGDIVICLTDLQITATTLEQFYATDLGKAIQNGFYPPYSATNTIYEADLSEMSLSGKNLIETLNNFETGVLDANGQIDLSLYSRDIITSNNNVNFHEIYAYGGISSLFVKVKPNTTYRLSFINEVEQNDACYIKGYDINKSFVKQELAIYFGSTKNIVRTFTTSATTEYIRLSIQIANQNVDRSYSEFLLIPSEETDTTYTPYVKPQTVSILQNEQPLRIGGIGTAKDTWKNRNGKVERKIGSADLGTLYWFYSRASIGYRFYVYDIPAKETSNDIIGNNLSTLYNEISADAFYLEDINLTMCHGLNSYYQFRNNSYDNATTFKTAMNGVILKYELETPTTETANSYLLPKGITKVVDANGLELEFEDKSDILNFSSKIVNGKTTPTISSERIITKGFTSGGEHFTQLYIYADGEIWYVNGSSSAQAFVEGIGWELEYKQLQFDSGVRLTNQERNALLNIYDLV